MNYTSFGPKTVSIDKKTDILYCKDHESGVKKELEFYCLSCDEYICSKCVLVHTNRGDRLRNCSPHILKMKEKLAQYKDEISKTKDEIDLNSDYFDDHHSRIMMKFEEEKDRVQEAFRVQIEKLEEKQKEFIDMIKEQMEKEISILKVKQEKRIELHKCLASGLADKEDELYQDSDTFMKNRDF